MKRYLVAGLMVGIIVCTPLLGVAAEEQATKTTESHGVLHKIVMYIPNRVLDVFDIVRFRVRVGPGVAVDARATKVASAFVGSYASVYVGLPGPRNRPFPKLPIGFESRNGVQASVVDATVSGGVDPDYGLRKSAWAFKLSSSDLMSGSSHWRSLTCWLDSSS